MANAKIAFFVRALDGGGATRDMILLANAVAARRGDVDLLTLVPEGRLRSLVDARVTVVSVPGSQLRSAVPGLRRTILERRPNVLISAEAAPNLVGIVATRLVRPRDRPRLVLREVGSPSIAARLDPYRQTRLAYRALRLGYRLADAVITLTEGAAIDLAANFGVPSAKLHSVASNAVMDGAALVEAGSNEVEREQGLVVAVGRLAVEKDHATLIRAFAKLDPDRGRRLEIAGDGPLRAALDQLIGEVGIRDRATLTGFAPNPFAVFRRAVLAVSSSRYEGFGNAIIEALACGTPIVATDCPYGPSEILAGGRYGLLVPVGDVDALAGAMTQALATRPDRAALRARAAAHTAGKAADAVLAVVDGLDRGRLRPA